MRLRELLDAVKEKNLTKTDLESYRDELSSLFAAMQLELADIRKAKALFMFESSLKTVASKEVAWGADPRGQREIELSHYSRGVEKVLSSLRSRIYQIY